MIVTLTVPAAAARDPLVGGLYNGDVPTRTPSPGRRTDPDDRMEWDRA